MPKWGQLDNKIDLKKNENYNKIGSLQNFTKGYCILYRQR